MASKMVGRAKCPECGFDSAHVKQSEKCLYRYCPDCGSQHYAKSPRQVDDLMKKTRVDGSPTPSPSHSDKASAGTATPSPIETTATGTPASLPAQQKPRHGLGLFQ